MRWKEAFLPENRTHRASARLSLIEPRAYFLLGGLALLNIVCWIVAFVLFADRPAVLATALLAWVFGLRHAVDADHIAAIDNVVRKLMHRDDRPYAVGFFFSLGHSTVVVGACLLLAVTAAALKDSLSSFKTIGGVIGTSVSALFLLAIALANIAILIGVWRTFRTVAKGGLLDHDSLDTLLSGRGLLARLFKPIFRIVSKSWHMYPLGFLFGLGFDTATEIGLLSIAASEAANGMPLWHTLVFPALFTAGMALVDTLDSTLMVGAYGWAFVNPIRKLWYNLTITAASVAVALFIGSIEALALLADRLGLEGGLWDIVAKLSESLAAFGFAVVGLFVVAWLISMAIYRARNYDQLEAGFPPAG